MSKVPANLQKKGFSGRLTANGLKMVCQGKVRDTYIIPGVSAGNASFVSEAERNTFLLKNSENLLVIATDRISIFDFVLNTLIPKKGEVLTALTHFWLTTVLCDFEHHLVVSELSDTANGAIDLREVYPYLPVERCLVVKNLTGQMYPFELIFRYHLGGSVFKKYQETGIVSGQKLPLDLPKWSKLKEPLFTPSTKEEVGHDINVDANYFFMEMDKKGEGKEADKMVATLTEAYKIAYAYAEKRGILILDTKFETTNKCIADEFLTPDSSRFCEKKDWEESMEKGREPQFLDKEPVRIWGKTIETPFYSKEGKRITGINHLNPEDPLHEDFVHRLSVPLEIIENTTERYLNLFQMLTGYDLKIYQQNFMGV